MYDPSDNSAKCYELAISTMRDKLASFPRPAEKAEQLSLITEAAE